MNRILVNGEPRGDISVLDRGFQYGDGLFETIAVHRERLRLWDRHVRRLRDGCRRLAIPGPPDDLLDEEARRLCTGVARGVLKIIVTRGAGGRGYAPPAGDVPATRVLTIHPWPDYPERYYTEGVAVRVCRTRLADSVLLGGLKHLNRLEQITARSEWHDPSIAEGLMLDHDGHVVEGTMSNVFLVGAAGLITPDVARAGVAGVMRGLILDAAAETGLACTVRRVTYEELQQARELFLCNSLIGAWPVKSLEQRRLGPGPVTRQVIDMINSRIY